MLKRLFSGLGLATVLATAAQAQFVLNYQGGATYNDKKAAFVAGGVPVTGNFLPGSPFSVWCVDQEHFISTAAPANYLVNVARLDGAVGNLGATRIGQVAGDLNNYTRAAWLAATMDDGPGTIENKQYAIWAIIHNKSLASYCETWDGAFDGSNSDLAGCTSSEVITDIGDANAGWTNINEAQWYVLTGANNGACGPAAPGGDVNLNCQSGTSWNSQDVQELIAHCEPLLIAESSVGVQSEIPPDSCERGFDPPDAEEPTPEPATMSLLAIGLAGMAGTSVRRRNRKAAK